MDIQKDFTNVNNLYPKSRTQTLHLLEKYSKISVLKFLRWKDRHFHREIPRKETVRGGDDKTYEKKYWKYKELYKCDEKVHPESHCNKNKKYTCNDYKSTKTTSSRSNVKKLENDTKMMYKAFTTFNTQIQRMKEADSYLSHSEDEDETSHFQISGIHYGKSEFQFS